MLSFSRRRLLALAGGALLVAAVALGSAVAAVKLRSASSVSGRNVTAVKIVSSAPRVHVSLSTTFAFLPGAAVNVTVPAPTQALLLVRFSGESFCDSSFQGSTCAVRVLVNGVEATPSLGSATAFDSAPGAAPAPLELRSHGIDRAVGPLAPGSYTITVQVGTSREPTDLYLQDWSLIVERVKV